MGLVDDLISEKNNLETRKTWYTSACREVAEHADPFGTYMRGEYAQGHVTKPYGGYEATPISRGRELYDTTVLWANDRLFAAILNLIYPRSQKWHGLGKENPFGDEPTGEEERFFDLTTDYLFAGRNDYRSNYWTAKAAEVRSAVTYGTGIMYTEENTGAGRVDPMKVPIFYRHIPISQAFLGVDAFNEVDKCFRYHEMTAGAAMRYFDGNCSAKVKQAYDDPKRVNEPFMFMHCVVPRKMVTDRSDGFDYPSFWIEVDSKHLISESGFFEFPYQVSWWSQAENSAYGYSPVMVAMSDSKMLQVMGKQLIQAGQQAIRPPMATLPGIYRQRLNLNPGAVNPGYLDDAGRVLAQPLIPSAPTLPLSEQLVQQRQLGVQRHFYTELFQTLSEKPDATATEVLVRENEKSAMLAPVGDKMRTGGAKTVERELRILERKGAFEPGSRLEAPESLAGEEVGTKWKDPLTRLQRVQDLQGVESLLATTGALAQYDPSVLDRINSDEIMELTREIRGAPRKVLRDDNEVEEIRAQKAQQQEAAAVMQLMEQGASAAGKATPALQALNEAQIVAA